MHIVSIVASGGQPLYKRAMIPERECIQLWSCPWCPTNSSKSWSLSPFCSHTSSVKPGNHLASSGNPPHPPLPIIAAKLLQKCLLLGLLEPSNTHTPSYISKDGVQLLSLSAHFFFFQHERERKLVLSRKLRLLTDVNRVQLVLSFKWCPMHAAILSEMVVTVVFTRSTTCFLPFNLQSHSSTSESPKSNNFCCSLLFPSSLKTIAQLDLYRGFTTCSGSSFLCS